jgi:hypothetical protein
MKQYPLYYLISDIINVDGFTAKAGRNDEIIVVAFYLNDKEPAEKLNTFIQRGYNNAIDCEVSPNPDENGKYLLFVEFKRIPEFSTHVLDLLDDIQNLTGKKDWKFQTYKNEKLIDSIGLINMYTKSSNIEESLKHFIVDSVLLNESHILFKVPGKKISATIEHFEDYSLLSGLKANLYESSEKIALRSILPIGSTLYSYNNCYLIEFEDKCFMLKDVELQYN